MSVPTKAEAIEMIRAHSYPYSEDDPRPCIHTRLGGIGADWGIDTIVGEIEEPENTVEWGYSVLGHDLVLVRPGQTDLFIDVHHPDRADDCARCSAAGGRTYNSTREWSG